MNRRGNQQLKYESVLSVNSYNNFRDLQDFWRRVRGPHKIGQGAAHAAPGRTLGSPVLDEYNVQSNTRSKSFKSIKPATAEVGSPWCTHVWNFSTGIFWIFEQDLETCPCQIRRGVSGSRLDSESWSDSCFDLSVCLVLFTGVLRESPNSSLRTNWLSPRFYLFLSFIPSFLYWKIVSH